MVSTTTLITTFITAFTTMFITTFITQSITMSVMPFIQGLPTFWHRQTDTLHGNWEAEVDLFRYSIEAFECATSCSSRRTARKGVSRK